MAAVLGMVTAALALLQGAIQKAGDQHIGLGDRRAGEHLDGTGGQQITGTRAQSAGNHNIHATLGQPAGKQTRGMFRSGLKRLVQDRTVLRISIRKQELLAMAKMFRQLPCR